MALFKKVVYLKFGWCGWFINKWVLFRHIGLLDFTLGGLFFGLSLFNYWNKIGWRCRILDDKIWFWWWCRVREIFFFLIIFLVFVLLLLFLFLVPLLALWSPIFSCRYCGGFLFEVPFLAAISSKIFFTWECLTIAIFFSCCSSSFAFSILSSLALMASLLCLFFVLSSILGCFGFFWAWRLNKSS